MTGAASVAGSWVGTVTETQDLSVLLVQTQYGWSPLSDCPTINAATAEDDFPPAYPYAYRDGPNTASFNCGGGGWSARNATTYWYVRGNDLIVYDVFSARTIGDDSGVVSCELTIWEYYGGESEACIFQSPTATVSTDDIPDISHDPSTLQEVVESMTDLTIFIHAS